MSKIKGNPKGPCDKCGRITTKGYTPAILGEAAWWRCIACQVKVLQEYQHFNKKPITQVSEAWVKKQEVTR